MHFHRLSRQLLHEHLHLAAAGQPDLPGALVVTPKSSSCGVPVSIVFIAASATAPSMQPPDTDPAILPDLVTAIWLPAGRGELPQVSVTVATATCSPAARQSGGGAQHVLGFCECS